MNEHMFCKAGQHTQILKIPNHKFWKPSYIQYYTWN